MTYDGPGGGYSSASETRPGVFWINLIRPWERYFDINSVKIKVSIRTLVNQFL